MFTGWTIWRNLTTEKEEAYGDPEMFEISYFSERETPLLGSELWEPFVEIFEEPTGLMDDEGISQE